MLLSLKSLVSQEGVRVESQKEAPITAERDRQTNKHTESKKKSDIKFNLEYHASRNKSEKERKIEIFILENLAKKVGNPSGQELLV